MDATAAFTLEGGGSLLVGVAALVSAAWAIIQSRRAGAKAQEAIDVSPAAVLEGLRTEVQAIVDAYHEASERWTSDRSGMESSLGKERLRADAAEAVVFVLRSQMATLKLDLAAARAEVADLRTRFEQAISRRDDH